MATNQQYSQPIDRYAMAQQQFNQMGVEAKNDRAVSEARADAYRKASLLMMGDTYTRLSRAVAKGINDIVPVDKELVTDFNMFKKKDIGDEKGIKDKKVANKSTGAEILKRPDVKSEELGQVVEDVYHSITSAIAKLESNDSFFGFSGNSTAISRMLLDNISASSLSTTQPESTAVAAKASDVTWYNKNLPKYSEFVDNSMPWYSRNNPKNIRLREESTKRNSIDYSKAPIGSLLDDNATTILEILKLKER